MPIEHVDVPFSDGWWLRTLSKKFGETPKKPPSRLADPRRCGFTRREWQDMLWARFTGNGPLFRVSDRYADATREFIRLTRTNYAALVVEALQNRTQFVGARTGADNDADGDDTVRAFLNGNGPFMADALTYAYSMGSGGVLVAPPQDGEPFATATAEDPRQFAWVTDPVRQHVVRAALKLYRDEEAGQEVAHLYLPANRGAGTKDRIRVAVRSGTSWSGLRFSGQEWEWDDSRSGDLPESVQGMGVPFVPVVNRLGMGEFEASLDLLDRITNNISDRLWTQKYQTFIQRALIGNLPENDKNGNKIDYDSIFEADPGALWRMPEKSEIWESKQVDLGPLLAGSKADLLELSAVTQTPLFMFTPDAASGSAEGASLMREGLTFKAEDRISRFNFAAVRIARLGLAFSGKPEIAKGELQPMWAPVERFSLQQRGAAAVQAKTSGMPTRSIMSDVWQFPPATVARMEKERRADLILNGSTTPTFQAP